MSEFPGIQKALDVEGVLDSIRQATAADDTALVGASILDVRYRPDGPCWILYRLKGRSRSGRSMRQLASARLLRRGENADPVPERWIAQYRSLGEKLLETPILHVDDVPMVVYAYPLDLSLPGLFDAADPIRMKAHLNATWAERKVRVLDVEVAPLGYTPGARAAFSYEVTSESRETGVPELRRFVGKMHAKKPASRLFADAWALWRAGKGKLAVAPPVGYIGAVGLTLQEKLDGVRLGGVVEEPHFVKRVRRTARVLAAMHRLALPLSTRRKAVEEAATVHRWAGVLTAIRPELASRVDRLRDRLASEIEARTLLSAPIHADFHHTNVLVDGDRVRVIDLDEMAFGDPMVDVGRFMASLRVPARRAFGNIEALGGASEAFLEEYLKRTGGYEPRARLFEAASLLIAAGSSFRIQRPGWEEEVSLLLAESERLAREAGRGQSVGGAGDRKQALGLEERRKWASDPIYMQAILDPHVRETYGAQLTSCRIEGEGESRWRYGLRGARDGKEWRASVEGLFGWERGGPSLVRRLEQLNRKLRALPEAPLLPLPLAYLRPLSLLVWEVRAGTRLSHLVGSGSGADVAGRLARALAALHGTSVDLEALPLARELQSIRRKVESLKEPRAVELLDEVEARSQRVSAKVGPIMRTVHPHHVLCVDGKIAFDRIENVRLSHPLIDAGDFLARLAALGLSRSASEKAEDAAASFREAYSRAGEVSVSDIATFEAGALLRMAATRAEAKALVRQAETVLARW